MKKILLIWIATISMYMVATAQQRSFDQGKRSFLIFTAGPAFPIGDFASTNINNDRQGLQE